MNRKVMPVILMLLAGALTSLLAYFRGFGLKKMLLALMAAMVVFFLMGSIIRMILDNFDKKNEEAEKAKEEVSDEGEVIEKEAVTEEVTADEEPSEN